jgi:predicted porin
MKKPLVALAALVFTTLVSAQSSVTLYGIADFWVGSSTDKGNTAASGGLAASRWGIKGKEDLGDGLEAGFVLEQVFDLASGAAPGGFNRQSYVSLAGSFGELRLGNVLTPLDDINGSANSGGDSLLAALSGVWVGFNTNPLRQIYYATPEVGGLGAAVSRSLSGQRGRDVTSIRVNYNEGPLYAGLAWQTDKQSAPGLDVRHVFANGSYDFGVVKLLGSARRVTHPDSGADRTREYQMGLEVPVSDALVVSTGYARSTDKSADLQVAQRQGYGFLLTYALSKRTALYGGLQRNTEKMTNNTARLTAAGIHHTF